jgi:LAS superfamily LD-carboxypeptidase LdcB
MAIVAPDNMGRVDLGRSQAGVAETYVRPAVPFEDNTLSQLASGLSKLGVNFGDMGRQQAAKNEELEGQKIQYYAGQVRGDIQSGKPIDAQLGTLLPGQSQAVRARVASYLGGQAAEADFGSQLGELYSDPQFLTNPAALDARIQEMRLSAAERVKADPFYGNGYLSAFDAKVSGLKNQYTERQSGFYQEAQYDSFKQGAMDVATKARQASGVSWQAAGDTGKVYKFLEGSVTGNANSESVRKLNATFADRLENMLAAAPPEVAAQIKIVSGFRSTEKQAQLYNKRVKEFVNQGYGEAHAKELARKWVAPPGRSMHNHGEAVDLASGDMHKFGKSAAGKWVHANAEKYGLYFPMGHEPWHIEMVGGRRQNGGQAAPYDGMDVKLESDGKGGGRYSDVMDSIIMAESSGNPDAQNQHSSAGGLGGFTDATWIDAVRSSSVGARFANLSDKEVLKLKKGKATAELQRTVLGDWIDGHAKTLAKHGLSDHGGNIYGIHFLGRGLGPKVLKAADHTPMSDLMDSDAVKANPEQARMTVGQFKEWAAGKAGTTLTGTRSAQNAARSMDAEYAQTSSLDNIVRRKALAEGFTQAALANMDASQLDNMPPELITPEIRNSFAQTRRQIEDMQFQQSQRQIQEQARQRTEATRNAKIEMNEAMARGEQVNPAKYAGDPEAFAYARTLQDQSLITDEASKANAMKFQYDLEAATVAENYAGVMGSDEFLTRAPTKAQIIDRILTNRDLNSKDRQALMAGLETTMNSMAIVNGPEAQAAYNNNVSEFVKLQMQNEVVKLQAGFKSFNLDSYAKNIYNDEVRAGMRAYIEDNGGQMPAGTALRTIIKDAISVTNDSVAQAVSLLEKGEKPGGENTKPGDAPAAAEAEDGVIDLDALEAQQSAAPAAANAEPGAEPTSSPAAPAQATEGGPDEPWFQLGDPNSGVSLSVGPWLSGQSKEELKAGKDAVYAEQQAEAEQFRKQDTAEWAEIEKTANESWKAIKETLAEAWKPVAEGIANNKERSRGKAGRERDAEMYAPLVEMAVDNIAKGVWTPEQATKRLRDANVPKWLWPD